MNEVSKMTKKIETNPTAIEFVDHDFKGNVLEEIDPGELQAELKTRMKLLDKLVTEGHNTKDINEIRTALNSAIRDLSEIIEDPETDLLSEEIV